MKMKREGEDRDLTLMMMDMFTWYQKHASFYYREK